MNLNTLRMICQGVYGCLERRADALFSLSDALVSEPQAHSLPELSLSPFFERGWTSVYAALDEGRINIPRLRGVWAEALLKTKSRPKRVNTTFPVHRFLFSGRFQASS